MQPAEASAEGESAAGPDPSTAPIYIYTSPCVTATGVTDPGEAPFELPSATTLGARCKIRWLRIMHYAVLAL